MWFLQVREKTVHPKPWLTNRNDSSSSSSIPPPFSITKPRSASLLQDDGKQFNANDFTSATNNNKSIVDLIAETSRPASSSAASRTSNNSNQKSSPAISNKYPGLPTSSVSKIPRPSQPQQTSLPVFRVTPSQDSILVLKSASAAAMPPSLSLSTDRAGSPFTSAADFGSRQQQQPICPAHQHQRSQSSASPSSSQLMSIANARRKQQQHRHERINSAIAAGSGNKSPASTGNGRRSASIERNSPNNSPATNVTKLLPPTNIVVGNRFAGGSSSSQSTTTPLRSPSRTSVNGGEEIGEKPRWR